MNEKILRFKDLRQIVGLSRSSIWRLERDGEFPDRRIISPGAVGWLYSEVLEWMESRDLADDE